MEPLHRWPCDFCEDYLARDLAAEDQLAFELHLPECKECQAAVTEARRVEELLVAAIGREEIPSMLTERIDRAMSHQASASISDRSIVQPARPLSRSEPTRGIGAGLGIAAAVSAVALSMWGLLTRRQDTVRPVVTKIQHAPAAPNVDPSPAIEEQREAPAVHAQLGSSDDFITVPVESRDPTISIFWSYPTKRITQENADQRKPRLLNSHTPSDSGSST